MGGIEAEEAPFETAPAARLESDAFFAEERVERSRDEGLHLCPAQVVGIAPADGERLTALGRVVKPGRTLTFCDLEVTAHKAGQAKLCAKGLQTIMRIDGRPDVSEE